LVNTAGIEVDKKEGKRQGTTDNTVARFASPIKVSASTDNQQESYVKGETQIEGKTPKGAKRKKSEKVLWG